MKKPIIAAITCSVIMWGGVTELPQCSDISTSLQLNKELEKTNKEIENLKELIKKITSVNNESKFVSNDEIIKPIISYYDKHLFSKSSFNVKPEKGKEYRSEWQIVPTNSLGYLMYPREGGETIIYLVNDYTYSPGYYETPKYQKNWSRSQLQFVLANQSATSEQINKRLEELSISPEKIGGWWSGSATGKAQSVRIKGLHPYSRLFVRFTNISNRNDKSPQNIKTFGSNSTFAVDKVVNYRN
jgi:hypothetical protein